MGTFCGKAQYYSEKEAEKYLYINICTFFMGILNTVRIYEMSVMANKKSLKSFEYALLKKSVICT